MAITYKSITLLWQHHLKYHSNLKYTPEQKEKTLYNLDEIADILGVSYKTARNRLSLRGIKKIKSIEGRSLFSMEQIQIISIRKRRLQLPKKQNGFYIIESKINL